MATNFTGIVLAGGRSTRMGRDKALLPWGEGTLLDRMIERLREAGALRMVVSGDRPSHGGIPDAWRDGGPVCGLASVVPHCGDGVAVVVPVDLPLLDTRRIRVLAEATHAQGAAFFAGHPLPCGLRIDTSARRTIAGIAAAARGPSMRQLLATLGATELPAIDSADLRPCNTPADWAALTS